jgi:hypothetical protein
MNNTRKCLLQISYLRFVSVFYLVLCDLYPSSCFGTIQGDSELLYNIKGGCWGDHLELKVEKTTFLHIHHRVRVTKFLRWCCFYCCDDSRFLQNGKNVLT